MNEKGLELLRALIQIGKRAEAKLDDLLDPAQLSVTKLLALQQLEAAAEPLSLGDLADRLQFVKSNATQLADNLEAAQLVRRIPDALDRRCKLLEVTESGKTSCQDALDAVAPLIERIERLYSVEERIFLTGLLNRMNESLK